MDLNVVEIGMAATREAYRTQCEAVCLDTGPERVSSNQESSSLGNIQRSPGNQAGSPLVRREVELRLGPRPIELPELAGFTP